MKPTPTPLAERPQLYRVNQGAALILVLGFLVLITGLVVAFFSSVTTELTTASSYANGASTAQLADSAVGMVMAQIKTATSGTNIAWASQPGMVRTFGNAGAPSDSPLAYYKLYSSDSMIVPANQVASFDLSSDLKVSSADAVTDWSGKPAIFTDLNSPLVSGSTTVYPIIDPTAVGLINGFALSGSNNPSTDGTSAKMPVKWIYVLQDGTLTAPKGVDSTGKIANWSGAAVNITPSKTNPIVGRIAFWTDDETCKVNVNTAAGDISGLPDTTPGAFWDAPRLASTVEKSLATSQPLKNEFQRYPGHPATVSLSSVFPSLSRQEIADIAPRIALGTSAGGTVDTYLSTATITTDKDRLYTSADELVFTPTRTGATPVSSGSLAKAGFFLTASSRAPEVNLFGKPRISLWPLNSSPTARTGVDNLMGFCSTTGSGAYYLQRSDAISPTNDYANIARNKQLYSYLQTQTGLGIPGFGPSTFFSKYGSADRDQILTEIIDYIRCVNIRDTQTGAVPFTPKEIVGQTSNPTVGQVTPLQISGSGMGFGRIQTISEAALIFMATGTSAVKSGAKTQAITMKAMLAFEFFSPSLGYPYLDPGLTINTGTGSVRVNGVNYPFCSNTEYISGDGGTHNRPMGGTNGVATAFRYYRPAKTNSTKTILTAAGSGATNKFGLITLDIPLTGCSSSGTGAITGETFNFGGLSTTLTIYPGVNGSTTPVQTIDLVFPPVAQLPAPLLGPPDLSMNNRLTASNGASTFQNVITPEDTVISLEPSGPGFLGDFRQVAMRKSVPNSAFQPHKNYQTLAAPLLSGSTITTSGTTSVSGTITTARGSYNNKAHSLLFGNGYAYYGATTGTAAPLVYASSSISYGSWAATTTAYGTYAKINYTGLGYASPDFPSSVSLQSSAIDIDNGLGITRDGPYINRPDASSAFNDPTQTTGNGALPYYAYDAETDVETAFSANRQIASAVQLGSLPAGFRPWQTLLFRPGATVSTGTHPSIIAGQPKDHLLLDLFWMPVVEPYAISEPLSTAGRINMNYQIAPFTYILRTTALRAAFDSTMVLGITDSEINNIKQFTSGSVNARAHIDPDETLKYFSDRFALADPSNDPTQKGIFVSASEICDIPLVPKGATQSSMSTYWDSKRVTGDNSREMPYNHLYPLLTTRSNSYTVHFRVQRLKKVASTSAVVWDDAKDQVTGEYRGSTLIERYVDASDSTLPDFATSPTATLDAYYKFRTLSTKKFAP